MAADFYKFALFRENEKGIIPGRDAVGEGCVFSSGKVAIAWLAEDCHLAFFDSIEDAKESILADGKTKMVPADLDFNHS